MDGFRKARKRNTEIFKWIALAQSDLHFFHSAHLSPDQKDGYEERRGVGRRSGKGDSVDPQEQRKDQYKRDQEEDLSCHGEQKSFQWFSNGGKEVGGDHLDSIYEDHEQENAHKADRKFIIKRVAASEQ